MPLGLLHLEVDVVARQFAQELLGQPVDDGLARLAATAAVLGLNAQYSVQHVASHVALIPAHDTPDTRHPYSVPYYLEEGQFCG